MKHNLPKNKKSRIKTAKGRKISSTLWLERQLKDPYVNAAQKEGFRSRAAYKLLEINEKLRFIKPNLTYIDLGAAPGSWTQILRKSAPKSKIIAVDLKEIESIPGVFLIMGDFTKQEVQDEISSLLGGEGADVVLSDMAAAACGHPATDHLRIMALADEVLEFCRHNLKKNGRLLIKILKGSDENKYLADLKQSFKIVKYVKPKASRNESREVYLFAEGLK